MIINSCGKGRMMAKNISSSLSKSSKSQSLVNIRNDFTRQCDGPSIKEDDFEKSEKHAQEILNEEIKKSLWQTILDESKEASALHDEWLTENVGTSTINIDTPAGYLETEVFPTLLVGMEKTLNKAHSLNVLQVQKCRFNGLDSLAEFLWNKNPRWPVRNEWLDVYDIPQFKHLMRLHPRPIFPNSWLWTTEEAVSRIQRYVRGWLVRKREDVQELRQFWKAIQEDKGETELSDGSTKSKALDICERYKLQRKKREKPF